MALIPRKNSYHYYYYYYYGLYLLCYKLCTHLAGFLLSYKYLRLLRVFARIMCFSLVLQILRHLSLLNNNKSIVITIISTYPCTLWHSPETDIPASLKVLCSTTSNFVFLILCILIFCAVLLPTGSTEAFCEIPSHFVHSCT